MTTITPHVTAPHPLRSGGIARSGALRHCTNPHSDTIQARRAWAEHATWHTLHLAHAPTRQTGQQAIRRAGRSHLATHSGRLWSTLTRRGTPQGSPIARRDVTAFPGQPRTEGGQP